MDDKLIRLARKVKTLEDELNRISKIKDLDGLLLANSDMSSRYRKSIAETVDVYKDYISNTKKELQDSLKAIQKEQTEKHTANKKNIDSLEAKLNKVKDDILNVSTSINKSIEDIQKDILKDIKDKNNQILLNLDKKDKELKEVKKENTLLNKELKALKDLVGKLELQKGDDGKSAYDIACELGFKGTKEEWIKSLHGKDGQDIELRGLRAFSDVKNDNKMYARKNKKWVEVENYDDTEIREDIAELQEENEAQTEQIQALQTENERIKATLPTTTGTGTEVTLQNTAELEFIQPPLPRGNSEQATAILPTGYTQLDYIESSKTQYIDIGITPDTTLEFDTTFNTSDSLSSSGYGCIFGSRVGSGNKDVQLTTYSEFGYSGTIRWGNTYGGNAYLSNNTKINVKLKDNKYYVDNEEKQSIAINASNDYNIFIFGLNAGGVISQQGSLKLYTFKLWKNGSLVRNYVPCKNASDEVGLYDLVSETFFGNSGTGTFTAGNTVTAPNPNFEVPIQNVTGDVEVLVQNKNLFDVSKVNNLALSDRIISGNSYRGYTVPVSAGEKWTISRKQSSSPNRFRVCFTVEKPASGVVFYNENGAQTSYVNLDLATSGTVIVPNNMNYLFVYLSNSNEIITNDMEIQIEKNPTATTYTPHQEQTLPLTLGNIELCKIGDYQDYFYKENSKWYLYKAIGKLQISENVFGSYSEAQNTDYIYCYSILYDELIANSFAGLSSHFINHGRNIARYTDEGYSLYSFGGSEWAKLRFMINKDLLEDTSSTSAIGQSLNKLFSEKQPIFLYPLATPTITEITDITLIEQLDAISQAISYEEQTNISGSSDESNPLFSVEAYQSIKLILAS